MPDDSARFHEVLKSLEKYPLFESPGLAALCGYLADHYTPRGALPPPRDPSPFCPTISRGSPGSSRRWNGWARRSEGTVRPGRRRPSRGPQPACSSSGTGASGSRCATSRITSPPWRWRTSAPGSAWGCRGPSSSSACAARTSSRSSASGPPPRGACAGWPSCWPPSPCRQSRTFLHPFLVEDMTTVLLAARTEPIPLRRGDEKPFARFVEETANALLSMPEWLERFTGLSMEGRIALALQALRLTGLLGPAGPADGLQRGVSTLSPSAGGRELALPSARRAARADRPEPVVRGARAPPALRPAGGGLDLLGRRAGRDHAVARAGLLLRSPLVLHPVRTISPSTRRPSAAPSPPRPGHGQGLVPGGRADPRPRLARRPSRSCGNRFSGSSSGAASSPWAARRRVFTQEGAAVLPSHAGRTGASSGCPDGGADGTTETEDERGIIVQPNFEIVFLSPSPAAEAGAGKVLREGRPGGRRPLQADKAVHQEGGSLRPGGGAGPRPPGPPGRRGHYRRTWSRKSGDGSGSQCRRSTAATNAAEHNGGMA